MNRVRLSLFATSLIIGVCCSFSQALAQTYPSKLIRVVVPAAAGGNLDLITRAIVQKLSETLRQSVVVENRPEAALIVGTQYVAKSAPDGYTLLAMANTTAQLRA